MTVRALLAVLAAPLAVSTAPAADPNYSAVAAQVKDGATVQTDLVGRADTGRKAQDLRTDGGILVGFDAAVSQYFDHDWIIAVRPLYRTPNGVLVGATIGEFDYTKHTDGGIRRSGIRQVTLVAKKGYAVSAVHVITGLNVDHLSLTFARTTPIGLDLTDTYASEEIGRPITPHTHKAKSDGRYIVGVNGRVERGILRALGLVHLKVGNAPPEPPKPATPTPTPVEPPKPPPTPRPKFTPAVETPPPERPRPAPKPKAEPPTPPLWQPFPEKGAAESSKAEPAPADQTPTAAEPDEPPSDGFPWIIGAVVGGVVAVVVGGIMFFGGKDTARKSVPRARKAAGRRRPRDEDDDFDRRDDRRRKSSPRDEPELEILPSDPDLPLADRIRPRRDRG